MNEDKRKIFESKVKNGTLCQSYVFYGDRGVGKFTFAKECALYLESGVWEKKDHTPSDVLIIEHGEKASIGIDEAREIKKFFSLRCADNRRRVVIIREAGLLTPEAQSALLKVIEEPSEHGLIILITEEKESLLPPLLSRVEKWYFRRLSTGKVKELLIHEFSMKENDAEQYAKISFGRIGRALELARKKEKSASDKKIEADKAYEEKLEERIIELYMKDKIKNSTKTKELNTYLRNKRQWNLNPVLQEKAAQYIETKK